MDQQVKGTVIGSTNDSTEAEREPFAGPSSRYRGYGSDEEISDASMNQRPRALDRYSWGTGTWKSHRSNKSDKN